MSKHSSGVNFKRLISDLADMYPFDIFDVIVIELIDNALDSKATTISINYNSKDNILIVGDDGKGMDRKQFDEYHDFAVAHKKRGQGIGFAGLGAKISFNIADRVITETCSKTLKRGSNWYFETNTKLVWEDIVPSNIKGYGTRVEVHFHSNKKPWYSTTEDLKQLLKQRYLPLLDSKFIRAYSKLGLYSKNLKFRVNNTDIIRTELKLDFELDKVRLIHGKRFFGLFGLAKKDYPLGPEICGILITTYGKIIKEEFFNQFPGSFSPRIFGVVEVPELSKFLTTPKTDFKAKGNYKEFEKLYSPIREEFKNWLEEIGIRIQIEKGTEAKSLERELKKIINDVPELSNFFGIITRKKDILRENEKGSKKAEFINGANPTFPEGEGDKGEGQGITDEGIDTGESLTEQKEGKKKATPITRRAPQGPKISFNDIPDKQELGWVAGNNIIINSGHPCYLKASSNNKSERLHCIFAIASAIQRFLYKQDEKTDMNFIDKMMSAWGKK